MSSDPLSSLVRNKPADTPSPPAKPRGGRFALLIPVGIVLGFALVMALLFGDRLLPARDVSVANVVTLADTPGEAVLSRPAEQPTDPFAAPVLFQASGWLEPDPLPTKATALVNGVVDQVFVLEGESVEKGDVLATLVDDDAELNLVTAEHQLATAKARIRANRADMNLVRAEIRTLDNRIAAAQAVLAMLDDAARRFEGAGPESVAELEIVEARQRVTAQQAEIAALESERNEKDASLEQLQSRGEELEAAVELAQTELDRRQLAYDRTQIKAPISGRILRLLVAPGQQRALGAENKDSAVIAYLYDPRKLQARIDVPLAEAAKMQVGQAVKVRSNFLPDQVFHGHVTRIIGEADLQRNTLQAKVAIETPDDRLRPDMLCRAEFLAPAKPDSSSGTPAEAGPTRVRLYVPEAALLNASADDATVWLLDAAGQRVQQREIALGSERREGYRRVEGGLQPGDRVVVDPPADLNVGTRITATKPKPVN